nr:hypothetical protein [Tanacetum cinerariifolium]
MVKSWIGTNRTNRSYIDEVASFIDYAVHNLQKIGNINPRDIPTDGPTTVEMVNATKDNFDEDDLFKFQELLLDAEKPLYKGYSQAWRTIDEKFPKIAEDPRNLRLGISAVRVDVNTGNRHHSVWLVLTVIFLQEKNVAESLVGTLLNVPGKTKDGVNARLDLAKLGVKPELFAMQEDKTTLPPAGYTLTNAEKDIFCEMLYNIKVIKGHVRNRNRPEGCIAEETIAEETIEFF